MIMSWRYLYLYPIYWIASVSVLVFLYCGLVPKWAFDEYVRKLPHDVVQDRRQSWGFVLHEIISWLHPRG